VVLILVVRFFLLWRLTVVMFFFRRGAPLVIGFMFVFVLFYLFCLNWLFLAINIFIWVG